MSFVSLLTEIHRCTLCADFLPLPPRPILQADPAAKILIAGQAPGRRAHDSSIPFDDASGERLRAWLGLTKPQFYDPRRVAILPMGFCFPGTGKAGDLPPRPECAAKWRQPLLAQLPNIELTLVIGRYALNWHKPGFSGNLTDAVQQSLAEINQHSATIVLPHPSPRNNRWLKVNPWFEAQLLPLLKHRITLL